jgi:hypothetical protein
MASAKSAETAVEDTQTSAHTADAALEDSVTSSKAANVNCHSLGAAEPVPVVMYILAFDSNHTQLPLKVLVDMLIRRRRRDTRGRLRSRQMRLSWGTKKKRGREGSSSRSRPMRLPLGTKKKRERAQQQW